MFNFKKKKDEQEITYDENTYEDYYEDTDNNTNDNSLSDHDINNNISEIRNNLNEIEEKAKNIIQNDDNKFSENMINSKQNTIIKKVSNFILIALVIITIITIAMFYFDNNSTNYRIKLNLTSLGLVKTRGISGNYQIDYLITPNSNSAPKYKVIDKNIIELNDKTSYITALRTGETNVEVFANNDSENIKTTLKVYVVSKKIPIENFVVTDMKIKVNKSDIITISPIPENTTEINFTYQSSDPSIIEVNNDGIMKGLKKGNANITISNNNISKTIFVNVY